FGSIVSLLNRRSKNLAPHEINHLIHHSRRQLLVLLILPPNVIDHRALGVGADDVAIHCPGLAETPLPADSLIVGFPAVGQPNKHAMPAGLKVHPEASNTRLADKRCNLAICKAYQSACLVFLCVASGHSDLAM